MATIQQAAEAAAAFAKETLGSERTGGLRLEELDSGEVNGEDAWLITLSMLEPSKISISPASDALWTRREYKIFGVSKRSGEVISMRIRELATS